MRNGEGETERGEGGRLQVLVEVNDDWYVLQVYQVE